MADEPELALDTLALHWREALDDAQEALDDLSRSRQQLRFPAGELRERMKELRSERTETEADLEQLARTAQVPVHRRLTGPRASNVLLGLGAEVRGCVFDLDGVLTPSAALHREAWRGAFDELLAGGDGALRPFTPADYRRYLEGKPRIDGVHAFLASRGLSLIDGSPDDPPGAATAFGIANCKNELLVARLRHEGVQAYDGSLFFLELAHEAKLRCAVVSASANTSAILGRAGLRFLIDELVDGNVLQAEQLRPKPEPDSVLEACRRLALPPSAVATFETTAAGVAAGRAAGAERVVVVERDYAPGARTWGADVVVTDLSELIDPQLV